MPNSFSSRRPLGLLLSALTGLILATLATWQGKAASNEMLTVVGTRNDFGVTEQVQVRLPGALELCRWEGSRLDLHQVVTNSSVKTRETLATLAQSLRQLGASGWRAPTGSPPAPDLVVDGPEWHFYLMIEADDGLDLRTLNGFPRVEASISLLLQQAKAEGVKSSAREGLLIDWWPVGPAGQFTNTLWRTSRPDERDLVRHCGALVPYPLDEVLRQRLKGKVSHGFLNLSGTRFRVLELKRGPPAE